MKKNTTTTLIVIRHGQTEWNVKSIWQGQQESPLTTIGQKQAEAVAKRLSSVKINSIYSSDLSRCLDTARASQKETGVTITIDKRLRERSFGLLEGYTKDESNKKFPGVWQQIDGDDSSYAPQNGESLDQTQCRLESFFSELVNNHRNETVVVFTHGCGIDYILNKVLNTPIKTNRMFKLWNCALNVFEYNSGNWCAVSVGDAIHLGGIRPE